MSRKPLVITGASSGVDAVVAQACDAGAPEPVQHLGPTAPIVGSGQMGDDDG